MRKRYVRQHGLYHAFHPRIGCSQPEVTSVLST